MRSGRETFHPSRNRKRLELVDFISRDGLDTPIYVIHNKKKKKKKKKKKQKDQSSYSLKIFKLY